MARGPHENVVNVLFGGCVVPLRSKAICASVIRWSGSPGFSFEAGGASGAAEMRWPTILK